MIYYRVILMNTKIIMIIKIKVKHFMPMKYK